MQRLAYYLEQARKFERLAAENPDPRRSAEFELQAESYRNLAVRRIAFLQKLGLIPKDASGPF